MKIGELPLEGGWLEGNHSEMWISLLSLSNGPPSIYFVSFPPARFSKQTSSPPPTYKPYAKPLMGKVNRPLFVLTVNFSLIYRPSSCLERRWYLSWRNLRYIGTSKRAKIYLSYFTTRRIEPVLWVSKHHYPDVLQIQLNIYFCKSGFLQCFVLAKPSIFVELLSHYFFRLSYSVCVRSTTPNLRILMTPGSRSCVTDTQLGR